MANILSTKPTAVLTNEVRLSFPHLVTPRANDSGDLKYSVCLLIPKSDTQTIELMRQAIAQAAEIGKDKFGGRAPAQPKHTLHDGDEALARGDRDDHELYAGHYFINASSSRPPTVVDQVRKPITDPEMIYGGCYAFAVVNFYAYNTNGNRGIACGIEAVMKSRDGERLGGGALSADVFAGIEIPAAPAPADWL